MLARQNSQKEHIHRSHCGLRSSKSEMKDIPEAPICTRCETTEKRLLAEQAKNSDSQRELVVI